MAMAMKEVTEVVTESTVAESTSITIVAMG